VTEETWAWIREGHAEAGGCLTFVRGITPERVIEGFGMDPGWAEDGARGPGQRGAGISSLGRRHRAWGTPFQPGGELARGAHPVLRHRRVDLKTADFAGVLRAAVPCGGLPGVKIRVGWR
jgi:hypothetical protein